MQLVHDREVELRAAIAEWKRLLRENIALTGTAEEMDEHLKLVHAAEAEMDRLIELA